MTTSARPRRLLSLLATAAALLSAIPAQAGCSRPIQTPLYASGNIVKAVGVGANVAKPVGAEVGGFLPDLLRKEGERIGCVFVLSIVPRARLEAMFAAGQADILMTATRTPHRDQYGSFTALVTTRATLVSFVAPNPPVHSIAELLARRELKVGLIRGQDYGPEFLAMSAELAKQKRLVLESATNVARLLELGAIDVTVMTPTVMAATLMPDPHLKTLIDKIVMEPLAELGWNESGAYVSKSSLTAEDRQLLENMFASIARTNLINEELRSQFPVRILIQSNKNFQ